MKPILCKLTSGPMGVYDHDDIVLAYLVMEGENREDQDALILFPPDKDEDTCCLSTAVLTEKNYWNLQKEPIEGIEISNSNPYLDLYSQIDTEEKFWKNFDDIEHLAADIKDTYRDLILEDLAVCQRVDGSDLEDAITCPHCGEEL